MTTKAKIHKVALFFCVAFVAVSTANAQQLLYDDGPHARYRFYFRMAVLLFASAGAWLYSQSRRPHPSSTDNPITPEARHSVVQLSKGENPVRGPFQPVVLREAISANVRPVVQLVPRRDFDVQPREHHPFEELRALPPIP